MSHTLDIGAGDSPDGRFIESGVGVGADGIVIAKPVVLIGDGFVVESVTAEEGLAGTGKIAVGKSTGPQRTDEIEELPPCLRG